MDKSKKKATIRQFNLSSIVLISLIFLNLTPFTIFFFMTQQKIVSELKGLEEEQQLHHMEDELDVLKSKFDAYKNMVGFVSQLPAVIEILDKGEELTGSISQNIAYKRYAGVLSRAFKKDKDVIGIHILDLHSRVRFSFYKNPETSQYVRVDGTNTNFDQDFLNKTLQMNDKNFLMSPLFIADENLRKGNSSSSQLLFRIFTPILLKNRKIGIFCCDIDLGILVLSFPEIHWVLNDGSFLLRDKSDENAFAKFPGLRDIFLTEKAGVWRNDQMMMAWTPFYKGKNISLSLWAGKTITLVAVQNARNKMLMDMLEIFLILLLLLSLIAFLLSKYINRISAQFLDDFRKSIFHQHKPFPGSKKRIREFSDFSENITYIIDNNLNLKRQNKQSRTELQKALDEVKTLRGIIPICSFCKRIRNDEGYYEQIEAYIQKHSEADFSHMVCPTCMKKYYPNIHKSNKDKS